MVQDRFKITLDGKETVDGWYVHNECVNDWGAETIEGPATWINDGLIIRPRCVSCCSEIPIDKVERI